MLIVRNLRKKHWEPSFVEASLPVGKEPATPPTGLHGRRRCIPFFPNVRTQDCYDFPVEWLRTIYSIKSKNITQLSSEGRDTTTLSMRKQYIAGRYTYHPGLRTTIRILCIDSSRGRRKVEVHQCFRRGIRSAWSCGCRARSLVRERHPECDTKRDLSIRVSGTMEAILRESRVTYRLSPSLLAGSGLVSKLASSGAPLEA